MVPTRGTLPSARSRHVGSGATGAREPSQVREEAALSGSAWVPPGCLACAASGPPFLCGCDLRCSITRATSRPRPHLRICASLYDPAVQEGCESGRIGTLGKRVWGNSPWVRIPLPPQGLARVPSALPDRVHDLVRGAIKPTRLVADSSVLPGSRSSARRSDTARGSIAYRFTDHLSANDDPISGGALRGFCREAQCVRGPLRPSV